MTALAVRRITAIRVQGLRSRDASLQTVGIQQQG